MKFRDRLVDSGIRAMMQIAQRTNDSDLDILLGLANKQLTAGVKHAKAAAEKKDQVAAAAKRSTARKPAKKAPAKRGRPKKT